MQCKFVMFQTHAVSPITFRFHRSVQEKIIWTSSCLEKSGKTGKNAPSVTGGQRAVTLCAGVGERKKCRFTPRVALWDKLSGAQVSEMTRAFTRCSAKTKTASDWSIYPRDFTPVHLEIAILYFYCSC